MARSIKRRFPDKTSSRNKFRAPCPIQIKRPLLVRVLHARRLRRARAVPEPFETTILAGFRPASTRARYESPTACPMATGGPRTGHNGCPPRATPAGSLERSLPATLSWSACRPASVGCANCSGASSFGWVPSLRLSASLRSLTRNPGTTSHRRRFLPALRRKRVALNSPGWPRA